MNNRTHNFMLMLWCSAIMAIGVACTDDHTDFDPQPDYGKVTEIIQEWEKKGEICYDTTRFVHDDRGRIIEWWDGGRLSSTIHYEADKITASGEVDIIYLLNENGMMKKRIINGKERETFAHNAEGCLTFWTRRYGDDESHHYQTWDGHDLIKRTDVYDPDNPEERSGFMEVSYYEERNLQRVNLLDWILHNDHFIDDTFGIAEYEQCGMWTEHLPKQIKFYNNNSNYQILLTYDINYALDERGVVKKMIVFQKFDNNIFGYQRIVYFK